MLANILFKTLVKLSISLINRLSNNSTLILVINNKVEVNKVRGSNKIVKTWLYLKNINLIKTINLAKFKSIKNSTNYKEIDYKFS